PPGEEARLPLLERTLEASIRGEVDVVRDLLVQRDAAHGSGPSGAPPVELRPLPRLPVDGERALLTGRVRAREYPVLPRREAPEDLRLHRLRTGEAQARLHAGERIRVHRGALLDGQPHLLVPVELVGREGDEPGFERFLGAEGTLVQ